MIDYNSILNMAGDGYPIRVVYLDGKLVNAVISADPINGLIIKYVEPLCVIDGECAIEALRGDVKVYPREFK
jgi:hypothetical protein